jgi:flagellum-specific ATP synthase
MAVSARLDAVRSAVRQVQPYAVTGRVSAVSGLAMELEGPTGQLAIGDRVWISPRAGEGEAAEIQAEAIGFHGGITRAMAFTALDGIGPGARVRIGGASGLAVSDGWLGRVIDPLGRPLDGRGALVSGEQTVALRRPPPNAALRARLGPRIDLGVKALNVFATCRQGQRLGLFAGSGVGKSTLLGMMTRYTNADVVVVGLIGERGREVKEFVEQTLGEEGRRRAVIIAAPADAPPLKRLRGAQYATAIAEWFRDRGMRVLLLMDSLTRFAQAQREIALAIGEPPATKGYPPSVFAMMPALVERAGNDAEGRGSITAFYTVLTEGDDYRHDPIADAARAILDGHIVLSRDLAEAGHYPAIDIEASISRVMPAVATREHLRSAQRFRQVYSAYRQQRDLIAVGAYQKGSDPQVDQAIEMWPQLRTFLQQQVDEPMTLEVAVEKLAELAEQVTG